MAWVVIVIHLFTLITNVLTMSRPLVLDADKTKLILKLVHERKRIFIPWPPNFGTNFLSKAIREIFRGNRTLFVDTQTRTYPVLYFDFFQLTTGTKTATDFENNLDRRVRALGTVYDVATEGTNYTDRLGNLLRTLHAAKNAEIVISVDEYDFPIFRFHKNRAKQNRQVLNDFFDVVKSARNLLRLLLVSGISRDNLELKNMHDVTLDPAYLSLF